MLRSLATTHSFFPAIDGDVGQIVRGEGIYLYDAEGRRYIDGAGAVSGVTSIGHGVAEVIEAIVAQARQVSFIPAFQFLSPVVIELCELIASLTPGSLSKVMLFSGGSEANESAVRLARQYHVERGHPGKYKIVARWQSYHGMTLGVTGVGGHVGRRRKFAPNLHDSHHIPPAYRYRCRFCGEQPRCTLACAAELESAIRWEGPENVAAFIAEPVVGAAMGAVPAPDGYFEAIREICDRYDVLFIADEVITGFGRAGHALAMEHWGVVPDIVATGKGMSGGYSPLAALIARDEVVQPLIDNKSGFVSGHTFCQNPISATAGLHVLRYMQRNGLLHRAREIGPYFLERLGTLRQCRLVGDVRGLGLLAGIELVADQRSKEPLPSELRAGYRLAAEVQKRGLIVYPGSGTADGIAGDHILLAPPLIITRDQVDEVVAILGAALEALDKSIR